MKVLCISKNYRYNGECNYVAGITVGKYYDVIYFEFSKDYRSSNDHFCIKDDYGFSGWYPMCLFKPLSEIREEKLNQIGI